MALQFTLHALTDTHTYIDGSAL